jgi:hypothetical protein
MVKRCQRFGRWAPHFGKIFDIKAQEAAPGEAEIEVEVEQQGPYSTLAPGERLTWKVQWRLYEVPAGLDISPGGEALMRWVENLLRS